MRVLPPPLPHQEQLDDAQESAAPRHQRHAQAAAQDLGHVWPAPLLTVGQQTHVLVSDGIALNAERETMLVTPG